MKNQKLIILFIVLVIMVSSFQVNGIIAQDGAQAESSSNWVDYKPSFGAEINQFYFPDTFSTAFDKTEQAGSHWLRYNGLRWSDVQPNNEGQWLWGNVATHDANISTASAAGMEVILVIRSTPLWAQKYDGYYCGPMKEAKIGHFANFMAEVVKRYSNPPYNVKYYELWNEPDEYRGHQPPIHPTGVFGCWGEPSDPTYYGGRHYGKMLKAVYPAVKTAVPSAQIVLGGLLLPCPPGSWSYCNMSNFLKGILEEAGGQTIFDYANFHGYATYNPAENPIPDQAPGYPTGILMERNEFWWAGTGGMVEGKLAYVRQVMASYGTSKPILMTEAALIDPYNRSSSNPSIFEARKADYLVYVFARNIAKGVAGSTWYHVDNHGWSKSGLLDSTNTPLPAYYAFGVLTNALDGALYIRDLSLGSGILGFEFTTGSRIWVLFSENGSQKSINVPTGFNFAYDLFGNSVNPVNGRINFTRPIYIEFVNTPPVANNNRYVISMEVGSLTVPTPGVLSNDYDADWNPITAQKLTDPSHGILTFNANGSFTYTPGPGFEGEDSFTYRAYDGMAFSAPATVTITDAMSVYFPLIFR